MYFPVQNFDNFIDIGNFTDNHYYNIGNYYYYHIPEFLYILYTESGPVRATGVWSCAHRHKTPAWSDLTG